MAEGSATVRRTQGKGGLLREAGSRDRSLAIVATILIVVFWLVHLAALPVGGISGYDEFYTLDRSISFSRMGDWFTVFSGNEPNFRKPPLQYWMSAALLEVGVVEVVALRLPSMLFALGTLVCTAYLARVLAPQTPWAMPLSVLLLSSSGQFWVYANSAMLDIGAAFFTTCALVGAIVALERPRAWYLVAVVLGFGALQKAPAALPYIAAALFGLWLAQRWTGFSVRTVMRDTRFRRAVLIALPLILSWPLLQAARYGSDALKQSHEREMFSRLLRLGGDFTVVSPQSMIDKIKAVAVEIKQRQEAMEAVRGRQG